MDNYYVYILTNKNNTVLYVGLSNNLKIRLEQHKDKGNKGFTKNIVPINSYILKKHNM